MINTLESLGFTLLEKILYCASVVYRYEDHETLIPVEVNYILWEMNGRIDFAYRATMEKVN